MTVYYLYKVSITDKCHRLIKEEVGIEWNFLRFSELAGISHNISITIRNEVLYKCQDSVHSIYYIEVIQMQAKRSPSASPAK